MCDIEGEVKREATRTRSGRAPLLSEKRPIYTYSG